MAPSVWYYNRSAPFWDFVASLEQQGAEHPVFATANEGNTEERAEGSSDPAAFFGGWGPWGRGHHGRGGWFGGPARGHHGPHHGPPHHGPHHGPHHHPHGPPPPPEHGPDGEQPPPPPFYDEKERECEAGPSDEGKKPDSGSDEPSRPHCRRPGGARGCGGRRGRGAWGRGGPFGGFPFGGHGFGGPGGLGAVAQLFQSQFTPGENGARANNDSEDFEPEADVFDTEVAFVIHVALAGAKKEDLGVAWDAEKSELTISGVVHRPGDEDFLKTLSLDERKIGAFLRKIRLGSRANPAQIDADAITAKLEDGVLTVTVPKEDKDWTEVKKVDVE